MVDAEVVVVWALRAALVLDLLWLGMSTSRSLRALRPQRFAPRPSTAQGLAGRFAPRASLVVGSPDGRAPRWFSLIEYAEGMLERILVIPKGMRPRGLQRGVPGTRVVATRHDLIGAGLRASRGSVVVVAPPEIRVGRAFVQRLVAPLVDPFVGAAVARVTSARPNAGLAARIDDLDRLAQGGLQIGRSAMGGHVTCEGAPFAIRKSTLDDVGGWQPSRRCPDADLVSRVYVRGYAVAYVEEAVALAPPPAWPALARRTRVRVTGLRGTWRVVRRQLRRTKVLDGPEKTDVRWAGRGTTAPLWLAAGWVFLGGLRLADPTWAPDAIGGALVLLTFATPVTLTSFFNLATAAEQSGRRRVLAVLPLLPPLALGAMWTGAGAAVASAFTRTGRRESAQTRRRGRPTRPPARRAPAKRKRAAQ